MVSTLVMPALGVKKTSRIFAEERSSKGASQCIHSDRHASSRVLRSRGLSLGGVERKAQGASTPVSVSLSMKSEVDFTWTDI